MRATRLFKDFFESEKAGGLLLVAATITSLLIANSGFGAAYIPFWKTELMGLSVEHWINDAGMAIFFLLIGLELERELYIGELSSLKDASFPLFAALGGMVVPASLFYMFNVGLPSAVGTGVPMATDIAFAIGVLSLLGKRVPFSLKVFLTALAVIDDLGAILVIAIFYSKGIHLGFLGGALGLFVLLLVLNRVGVRKLWPYLIGGVFMWICMLQSGVHATITGVLLAFAIPFGKGDATSPSYRLQHTLHKPVAFVLLPIFALANTCIVLETGWYNSLGSALSVGIAVGLVVGKPLGIFLCTYLAARLGFTSLPSDLRWSYVFSVGFLAGIGFTMSIFITLLAFNDAQIITEAKVAILVASLLAGSIGYMLLSLFLKETKTL